MFLFYYTINNIFITKFIYFRDTFIISVISKKYDLNILLLGLDLMEYSQYWIKVNWLEDVHNLMAYSDLFISNAPLHAEMCYVLQLNREISLLILIVYWNMMYILKRNLILRMKISKVIFFTDYQLSVIGS